jgi:hypothetical protein
MLELSIGKILLLALIVWIVWAVVRYRRRVRMLSEVLREARRQAERSADGGQRSQVPVNLQQCSVCGSYVAADAAPCGRKDCPHRGGGR